MRCSLTTCTFFISADFIYVNPSAYSCIESEYGANSLVSQISLRKVGGGQYRLTQFGGVVFARSDNDAVQTMSDIRNKTVAAASISGLGSGQMQFRLLQRAGMSYINDPLRLAFTSNQGKVVNGVLKGDFDVGFVRTDQLERSKDANGEPIDLSLVKVVDPIQDLRGDDGELFPFDSSTTLYPEWNLGALTFVPNEVSIEVQRAMLDLSRHADIGAELEACYLACSDTDVAACQERCDANLIPLHPELAVETMEVAGDGSQAGVVDEDTLFGTPFYSSSSLAKLAYRARQNGKYAGWRSTLSYMELRNMQEETGFIQKNSTTGGMACVRASRIYDAVVCPEGHFRKSVEEVEEGCFSDDVGNIGCPEEFQCVCRPCQRAFDVDVFPLISGKEASGAGSGCAKMDICGTTEQRQTITFRAVDNRKRDAIGYLTVVVSEGDVTREIKAVHVEGPKIAAAAQSEAGEESPYRHTYKFDIVSSRVGVMILEIFAGDSQIPESPLRVQVGSRSCSNDYGGDSLREADASGNCICKTNSVDIGGRCVALSLLLPAILIPTFFLAAIGVWFYVDHKKKQADAVWNVKPSELNFDDPPEIVGRGAFGLVLLAEYRGTQVAVKRVIPPKVSKNHKAAVRTSLFGRGRRSSTGTTGSDSLEHRDKVDKAFRTGEGAIKRRRSVTSSRRGSSSSWNTGSQRSFALGDLSDSDDDEGDNFDLESGLRSGNMAKLCANGSDRGMGSGRNLGKPANGHAGSASMGPGTASTTLNGTASTTMDRKVGLKNPFKQDQYSKLKADFISEMRNISKCECAVLRRIYWCSFLSASFVVSVCLTFLCCAFPPGISLLSYHNHIVQHPCITTVMGAVIAKKEEPMLIMEFMDYGSLYDLLHNETMSIEGELLLPILQDIAKGVRFLHAATPQVIHGDLKAQNVLVDSKFRAKVADFGLSQKKQVGATGTPYWMAPECLRGESENTSASDVFSFGIILYEVYSRKDPYEGEDYNEVIKLVTDPNVNKRPPVPESCPPQVQGLMSDCLVGIPQNRPTFEELDQRLRRLDVATIEPGELHLSHQAKKDRKLERTDNLLFDVFPQHIAEALRDGRKVEPEHREIVTIFFSDFVSFTDISSSLSPLKVSNMLDRLYNAFDDLSRKYDVFKVETIGDAYMAVTNLVKDQPDHAKRIAEFAVEAVQQANMTLIDLEDPSLGHVNIRVGFHCGPVVANVVGSRNPRFCLFGDTVNTASRMESNSKKNRIHCSERAARLVKKQYPEIGVRKRGRIPIKGKGEMKTYWINERGSDRRRESMASVESDRSLKSSSSKDDSSIGNSDHAANDKPAEEEKEMALSTKLPKSSIKMSSIRGEQHIPELGTLEEGDDDDNEEGFEGTMPLKG